MLAVSCAVGMFFGAFVSVIIDSALFEVLLAYIASFAFYGRAGNGANNSSLQIGESPFFATVFGMCLTTIGGLIVWRVAPERGDQMSRWRWLVCDQGQ